MQHSIYRVAEPEVPADGLKTTRKSAAGTATAEALKFSYADGPHDAETLMVHPLTGDLYVITKMRSTAAGVYKLTPAYGAEPVKAQKIAEVTVPAIPNGFLTGGDIAPDGNRVVICDYFAAYEFSLPAGAEGFDEIWKQKPAAVDLGSRNQGEAIAYSADGDRLFATSEGKHEPLIRVDRRLH